MHGLTLRSPAFGWRSHIVAWAFGTHFLFGSVIVVNGLGLSFFYYFPREILITIIDPKIDLVVWATSALCVSLVMASSWKGKRRGVVQAGLAILAVALLVALFVNHESGALQNNIMQLLFVIVTGEFLYLSLVSEPILSQSTRTFVSRVLIYFLSYVVAIEISSGMYYVVRSFDQFTVIGKVDAGIELQLSYASYGLLPWLYAAFLFSWIWGPLVVWLSRKTGFFQLGSKTQLMSDQDVIARSSLRTRLSVLSDYRLFIALAVAAFIGYYPYFENPPWLVGTDAYWRYYDPLIRMNAKGVMGGFVQALGERHPLSLAVLYLAQLVFHTTAFEVVRLAPLFLVVALGFFTWWFLAARNFIEFGLMVFMLSIMSITTTVGMYSSILANWMALVVWMAFFGYVAFRSDRGFRVLDTIPLLVMSTLILFIHPWTWGVFAASIAVVAIATLFQEKRKGLRAGTILVSIIVIDVLVAFLSLKLFEASQGWRVSETLDLYTWVAKNPESLFVFWNTVTRLTQVWAPFFSPLYIATSILGVLYLQSTNLTPWRRRLILGWLCASMIGSILVAPIGWDPTQPKESESQLWRMLFLTPFQLTAPFGIALITDCLRKLGMRKWDKSSIKDSYNPIRGVFLAIVSVAGALLALTPIEGRLILVTLPVAVGLVIVKAGKDEPRLLSDMILAGFLLVAFNYATRSLAQLLISPHNFRPDWT